MLNEVNLNTINPPCSFYRDKNSRSLSLWVSASISVALVPKEPLTEKDLPLGKFCSVNYFVATWLGRPLTLDSVSQSH